MNLLGRLLATFFIAFVLHLLIYSSGVLPFFDGRMLDIAVSSLPGQEEWQAESIVIVEIDEESLQMLGQWPWPRIVLAQIVQDILNQNPAVLGIDILFPEEDRLSPKNIKGFYQFLTGFDVTLEGLPDELGDHDRLLAEVLKGGPTVLPLFLEGESQKDQECLLPPTFTDHLLPWPELAQGETLLCNLSVLQESAHGFGFINAAVDQDGVFRRQALLHQVDGRAIPSFALSLLAQIDPAIKLAVPKQGWKPLTLEFAGRSFALNRKAEVLNRPRSQQAFQRISAYKALSGEIPVGFFTGKLVLVGATAAGLFDQYMDGHGEIQPGIFLHAALLENLLEQRSLYQTEFSKKLALALSFLFSLGVVWLVFKRHYLLSWVCFLTLAILSLGVTWQLLKSGIYTSLGYFLTPFSFLFFIVSLFFAILHYIERKRFLEDLGEAHSATIDSMTMVAETRDVETGDHILRTKEYLRLLAEYLSRDNAYRRYLTPQIIELICRAAPLHDIGKVGIPDEILKKPARLSSEEMEIMQTHVGIGRKIIDNAINSYNKTNEFLSIASNITYSHHEKWDGSGYPLRLRGQEIPLEGRMMAVADVYDALISRRCYKEPFSFELAEEIIQQQSGKHFDPQIVRAFFVLRHEFRRVAEKYNE